MSPLSQSTREPVKPVPSWTAGESKSGNALGGFVMTSSGSPAHPINSELKE